MSTFQDLVSLVLLIFVLSVMVQAIQELLKSALGTKAAVMKEVVNKFMGDHLPLSQIEAALKLRGLDITALENINKEDCRHLLDGISFADEQLKGIVVSAQATLDQIKDNIAASYEAARNSFQQAYTRKNKLFVIALSFLVVIPLNANLIILYQEIAADQATQQAIVGKAVTVSVDQAGATQSNESPGADVGAAYSHTRDQINTALQNYPILIRSSRFKQDFTSHPYSGIAGLLLMGILVSLGAPFWNDILKGMMGINTALNTTGTKSS
jgi:DNA-binding MltR family transcriptional regulator